MPYTTKDIVKKHILDHHIGSTIVSGEAVRLTGTDWISLSRRMLLAASETIMAREQNEPIQESASFAAGDTAQLGHARLMPESVVVACDSSLGRLYVENTDYHIDYDEGTIRRLAGGSIPPAGAVVVWYLYYRVYQRGIDYDIDYQNGTIRRRASGAIESGQTVLANFIAEYGSLDDAAIDNAIAEANEQVVAFIAEEHQESQERALVTAETYLAVSIICRIRGMESISPSRGKTSNEASSWAAISEMYRKEAYSILARFAAPAGSFNSPSKA